MKQSPAQVLRLAEALPETPENYRVRHEIINALKELVKALEPAS